MDITTLQSLRDRVANAPGPDRHADTLIAHGIDGWTIKKIGGKPHFSHPEEVPVARDGKPSNYPSYTSSIDAALALVERVLPGWEDFTGFNPDHYFNGKRGCAYCVLSLDDKKYSVVAHTRPLAIILATLDALIAQAKEKTDDQA